MSSPYEAAWRIQVASFILTASIAVYAYDWLLSISEEVEMVSNGGLTWPIAIYFLSRISLLGSGQLCIAAFLIRSMGNCRNLIMMVGSGGSIAMASTSFLFFLRVRAVYLRSVHITALFGALWLVLTVLYIQTDSTVKTERRSPEGYCPPPDLKSLPWLIAVTLVNDTMVFIAISYRLVADSATAERSWHSSLCSIVKGQGLYSLSRSLMRTGQLYYFSTILFFFVNLAVIWSPPVPAGAEYLLAALHVGFTNMMACRVFRGVALGTMQMEVGLTTTRIAAAFQLEPLPTARLPYDLP
ncbi:hypothetical protein FIBSPDRAFT_1045441 [Athelia psychrophila]|uniref:DUF6533 domain-containing protein n=1 Tax=Athelia psychrophila TaxID=1759441 RepID=A0A166I1U3_9AGAM|nr:hypothetical protein FIBSPDRAFT_1045441 [Fibularhizoctonia sp. CBS 109695]